MIRTKILATMGPAVASPDMLYKLFEEGVDICRVNFSHGNLDGHLQTLRIIREILFFEPAGRGTNAAAALDHFNRIITRRAVVFLISDFQAGDFSRELAVTAKRHDLIALRIRDERERVLPNIGIITLEDAETGEQIEINTADRDVRSRFASVAETQQAELARVLRRNKIDRIDLRTGDDYLPALRVFFKRRGRRLGVR